MPWQRGKLLVWDATCPDTFAPSYSALATTEAGAVAARAEAGKRLIYSHLDPNHLFELVDIYIYIIKNKKIKIINKIINKIKNNKK